jgi:hypothetical protein
MTHEHYCEGCERDDVPLQFAVHVDPGATEPTEWCHDCQCAMPPEVWEHYFAIPHEHTLEV